MARFNALGMGGIGVLHGGDYGGIMGVAGDFGLLSPANSKGAYHDQHPLWSTFISYLGYVENHLLAVPCMPKEVYAG